jgi:Zn-finger nucleic acid-binding protein/ribosomal protein L40E
MPIMDAMDDALPAATHASADPRAPFPPPAPAAGERVLIACPACARQYDASGLAAGTRVRCECGRMLWVEPRAPRNPRPLVCGRCGGKLEIGAQRCAYCDAEITLEERGLSGVCPVCYARLFKDARFCMECGVAIAPQAVRAIADGVFCPRCQGALQSRSLGSVALVECGSCAGLWLAPDVFDAICEQADTEDLVRRHLGEQPEPRVDAAQAPPGYLSCITCGDLMVRRNFGGSSGVIIDVCRGHGVWLDHREIERILDFVHRGGLMRAREREVAQLEARAERAREDAAPPLCGSDPELFAGQRAETGVLDALRWLGSQMEAWVDRDR